MSNPLLDSPVVVELRICLHENGALSVQGPVSDRDWCLRALEEARDVIKGNRRPDIPKIIVPGAQTDMRVPVIQAP